MDKGYLIYTHVCMRSNDRATLFDVKEWQNWAPWQPSALLALPFKERKAYWPKGFCLPPKSSMPQGGRESG